MALRLHVDTGLDPLADRLADALRVTGRDPFATDVVAVPGDGVRVWLSHALAGRLGVCANIRFAFPATVIRELLGPDSGVGRWTTGPLTWAVHTALASRGRADAVRARSIADLFDRYTVARPHMARQWGAGDEVGGTLSALAEHQRWQPRLWREVRELLGGPSDAEHIRSIVGELSSGGVPSGVDLPSRLSFFSISALPHPYLEVLQAAAAHVDIDVYSVATSPRRWSDLRTVIDEPLRHPLPREQSPIPDPRNRLNRAWGRSGEEGQLLLLDIADEVDGPTRDGPPDDTVLHRVQRSIADDSPPAHLTRDLPDDHTVVWHRTFGATRQAEVLRDHLLHLLAETDADGTARFEPRDIVVLTRDVERFAPIVEAAFAGDPGSGLPAIPLQVADRSLGVADPVAAAGVALLTMLDGRFRVDDVVELLANPAVGARFGLDRQSVSHLADLLERSNARWGLDYEDQARVGLHGLGAFTVGDALDRVLAGAMSGCAAPDLGPGDVAVDDSAGFDELTVIGAALDFVGALRSAHERLSVPLPAADWAGSFLDSLHMLVTTDGADGAVSWRSVERSVGDVRRAVDLAGERCSATPVDPSEMVTLLTSSLLTAAARPRFGTGRVTLSSLTALRGVPHKVVCLLGLDIDAEPSGFTQPDDLVAAVPCVGDRDPRSEFRAQILDAVMAAGDRLVLCSTGFDVRTRAEVAPAVVLSELAEAVGGILGHELVPVDHPRQGWSDEAFSPSPVVHGAPWSHDVGAARAAQARRDQDDSTPTVPVLAPVGTDASVDVHDLRIAVTEPVRAFCEQRLGLHIPRDDIDTSDTSIPLTVGSIDRYRIRRQLFDGMPTGLDPDRWRRYLQVAGELPPLHYGDVPFDEAFSAVTALIDAVNDDGIDITAPRPPVDIGLGASPGRPGIHGVLRSVIPSSDGAIIVDAHPSSLRARTVLGAITDLVVASVAHPQHQWSARIYRHGSNDARTVAITWRDGSEPADVLKLVVDRHRHALTTPLPMFADVTRHLAVGSRTHAAKAWSGRGSPNLRSDRYNRLFYDVAFDDLDIDAVNDQIDSFWRPIVAPFDIVDSDEEPWA